VLGLECSGEVVEVADDVSGWKPGDRAMALLAGGGFAEEVVVHAGSAMPVPEPIDLVHAAHAVLGAIGYSTEYHLHLFTRRARAFCLNHGDTDTQTERAAVALGLSSA